jgi:hypothetical protein
MVSCPAFRELALSFQETSEAPHHEVTSFKVRKKIFATLNAAENRCCLRLSAEDQALFSEYHPGVVWPVPNAWGKYGWTLVNLKKVKRELLKAMLTLAYCNLAPAKLAEEYRNAME